jgi:conjugal transfer pilus assembly protein TrbC
MVFYCGANEIVLICEATMRNLLYLMMFLSPMGFTTAAIQVFVSFSMPNKLLEETVLDAARHNVPVILNGFYHDSMQETAVKIFELSKKAPNLSMQIDPTAFERYHIVQVPAWVAENQSTFDVVWGNVTFEKAMDELSRFGDTAQEKS